jgi:NAD(P)-dependent dehydrogenase (short-subunit alcohol dehydrogenase family)
MPFTTEVSDQEKHMSTSRNGRFEGKVSFITGGSSGIGRATAVAFAREGASVVVMSRSEGRNQDTVRLVEEAGGKALAITGDVSRSVSRKRTGLTSSTSTSAASSCA